MIAKFFKHFIWRLEVFAYDVARLMMKPFSFDRVSAFFGQIVEWVGPKTSKHFIAETGMRIAFPDASDEQINMWLRESWNRLGRTFGEFPLLGRVKVFEKKFPRRRHWT